MVQFALVGYVHFYEHIFSRLHECFFLWNLSNTEFAHPSLSRLVTPESGIVFFGNVEYMFLMKDGPLEKKSSIRHTNVGGGGLNIFGEYEWENIPDSKICLFITVQFTQECVFRY